MKDIFNIPIKEGADKGKIIVYAPLKKYIGLVGTEDEASALVPEIESMPDCSVSCTGTDPDGYRTLMILPNNRCNFRCSYCYSAKGRSGTEIDPAMLHKVLEWFIRPDRLPGKKLTVIYIGGGEPLLSWPVVKDSILYAKELDRNREGGLYISVVTNCSIVSDDIIDLCLETGAGICASYDILEDIQNRFRGHYDEVTRNINIYSSRGVDVGITTVITEDNISRMVSMIRHMHKVIPAVSQVSFKPLVPDGYFSSLSSAERYYTDFAENFLEAKICADSLGIRLTCPYLNAVSVLQDRFCDGKFVLAADGNITGCNFVSSEKESGFDAFRIGMATADGVSIDRNRIEKVFSHGNTLDICQDCPAKYHCAGGCYADHMFLGQEAKDVYCSAMRAFLARYLQMRYAGVL